MDRTFEVRFFDRLTGQRVPFAPGDLLGASWDLQEQGGIGQLSIKLARRFDVLGLEPGMLVEGIIHGDAIPAGRIEPAPRFRGLISQPDRQLALAESWSLTAYGLMEDMAHVAFRGQLAKVGGADLAWYAGQILREYLRARPWLVDTSLIDTLYPQITYSLAIENVGVTRESFDFEGTVQGALAKLAGEAPGLIVWGWSIDPITGNNQFVFRARQLAVGHQLFVGDKITAYSYPVSIQSVSNRGLFTGIEGVFPNLLAAAVEENTDFSMASASRTNLLKDGGLESRYDHWHADYGASFKSGGLSEGSCYDGNTMALLDSTGETLYQNRTDAADALPAGMQLTVLCHARRRTSTDSLVGQLYIQFIGSSGPISAFTAVVNPASAGYWETFSVLSVVVPAGTTGYQFGVTAGSGAGGLLIDGCAVYDSDELLPKSWEVEPYGASRFVAVQGLYREVPAYWGQTSVRICGTFTDANDHDGHLRPKGSSKFSITAGQTVIFAIRARTTPGAALGPGKLWLEIEDNLGTKAHTEFPGSMLTASWRIFWHVHTFGDTFGVSPNSAIARIIFRGDTDILIDAAQVSDIAVGLPNGTGPDDSSPDLPPFQRASTFEAWVRAEDVCPAGSPAAESVNLYDVREAPSTIQSRSLTRWDGPAQAFARAWFEANAVPRRSGRVEVADAWTTLVDPLEGTLVRISGTASDPDDDYPARAHYEFSAGLNLSIELGALRPTLTRALAQ